MGEGQALPGVVFRHVWVEETCIISKQKKNVVLHMSSASIPTTGSISELSVDLKIPDIYNAVDTVTLSFPLMFHQCRGWLWKPSRRAQIACSYWLVDRYPINTACLSGNMPSLKRQFLDVALDRKRLRRRAAVTASLNSLASSRPFISVPPRKFEPTRRRRAVATQRVRLATLSHCHAARSSPPLPLPCRRAPTAAPHVW